MKTTKTTAHTAGPWRTNGPYVTAGGDWQLILAVLPSKQDGIVRGDEAAETFGERNANARLIAAAPELLAALEKMLEFSDARIRDCSRSAAEASLADSVSDLIARVKGTA